MLTMPSRRLRQLALALMMTVLGIGGFALTAHADTTTYLNEAAGSLAGPRAVYYSTAYPGQIRGNDITNLEQHILKSGQPVKVAFLPSAATSESGDQQAAIALALFTRLKAYSPEWAGSVAVVLPGVIVTYSSTVPTHATLLTEATTKEGRHGNVAVLKNWIDRLADANKPPSHFWQRLSWSLLSLASGIVISTILYQVIRRVIQSNRNRDAQLIEAGRAARQERLTQEVARWRQANGRLPGSTIVPDPQIDGWLDDCSELLENPPGIEVMDQVDALLTQVRLRHTEQLERPMPTTPTPPDPL